MRLEVRCCCQPLKVLGTMEVPEYYARPGAEFRVELLPEEVTAGPRASAARSAPAPERATIKVMRWMSVMPGDAHTSGIAVYGDERPLEFWRRVPTFREINEVRL